MRIIKTKNEIPLARARIAFAAAVVIITPIGFATKFYHGFGEEWVHLYAGDILYPMFWYFVVMAIVPRLNPFLLAGLNLTFDVLGEFSQLISTPFLESIRGNFIGRTLIGTGFDANDFIYYVMGNILAVLLYFKLMKLIRPHRQS